GVGDPLPGGDGDPGRAGDLHVLRVPAPPRTVLALQRPGRRAAGPKRGFRGGAAGGRVSVWDVPPVCVLNGRSAAMRYAKALGPYVLLVAVLAGGCGPQGGPTKSEGKKDGGAAKGGKEDDHGPHGKGPNGGVVFDLGKYHAEFTVDHDKKECTVLVLGQD